MRPDWHRVGGSFSDRGGLLGPAWALLGGIVWWMGDGEMNDPLWWMCPRHLPCQGILVALYRGPCDSLLMAFSGQGHVVGLLPGQPGGGEGLMCKEHPLTMTGRSWWLATLASLTSSGMAQVCPTQSPRGPQQDRVLVPLTSWLIVMD